MPCGSRPAADGSAPPGPGPSEAGGPTPGCDADGAATLTSVMAAPRIEIGTRAVAAALAASLLAAYGLTGCSSPCSRLAEATCRAQGDGSRACVEVRASAAKASDDDQAYCLEAMAILEGGSGQQGGSR